MLFFRNPRVYCNIRSSVWETPRLRTILFWKAALYSSFVWTVGGLIFMESFLRNREMEGCWGKTLPAVYLRREGGGGLCELFTFCVHACYVCVQVNVSCCMYIITCVSLCVFMCDTVWAKPAMFMPQLNCILLPNQLLDALKDYIHAHCLNWVMLATLLFWRTFYQPCDGCVYFSDRTKRTGPQTEGIKFGPLDWTRCLNLMRMFYDLRNFHLI